MVVAAAARGEGEGRRRFFYDLDLRIRHILFLREYFLFIAKVTGGTALLRLYSKSAARLLC